MDEHDRDIELYEVVVDLEISAGLYGALPEPVGSTTHPRATLYEL